MKYIVVRGPGGEVPILFARALYHRSVALQFGGPVAVISAGFARMSPEGIECFGSSSSLGIGSRPDADTTLFRRHLESAAPVVPDSDSKND